jgi:hypothetical protein
LVTVNCSGPCGSCSASTSGRPRRPIFLTNSLRRRKPRTPRRSSSLLRDVDERGVVAELGPLLALMDAGSGGRPAASSGATVRSVMARA